MKKLWMTLLAACIGAGALVAEEALKPGRIHWEWDDAPPEVKQTGRILLIDDDNGLRGTPPGSFVALAALPGKKIEWMPTVDTTRSTGGARLMDAVLAPDESAILLLERLGEGAGPYGSRLILFNLHNGRIANVFSYPNRRLSQLLMPPGSGRIVALQEAQEALKQPAQLLLLNPRRGGKTVESAPLPGPVSSLAFRDEKIWVKLADSNRMLVFPLDDLESAPQELTLRYPGGKIFFSLDGQVFFNVTEGHIEYRRLDGGELAPWKTLAMPGGYTPDFALPVGPDGDSIVLGKEGGQGYFVQDGNFRELAGKCGRSATWNITENVLIMGLEKNDSVALYALPQELKPRTQSPAGKLKPPTMGEVAWLFTTTGEDVPVWVVDHRANLYRMTPTGRRWNKQLLYRADAGLK